jgi:uncharacterized protein (TIGR03437 family)
MRQPFLGASACEQESGFVSLLSADGGSLPWSSYVDVCGIPAAAFDSTESFYIASPQAQNVIVTIAPVQPAVAPSADEIANAFSGARRIAPGSLVTIRGTALSSTLWLDEGLNARSHLPQELGGTRIYFDGTPAPIMTVSPNLIICVAPNGITSRTAVRVQSNGEFSNEIIMPVLDSDPGLLTSGFPDVTEDGNVRNADGTRNDADHPAAPGSTVTLFATGLGLTNPPSDPGSIAASYSVSVRPPWLSWVSAFQQFSSGPPRLDMGYLPGFVTAIIQIQMQIPSNWGTGQLERLPVWLANFIPIPSAPYDYSKAGNRIYLYIR